MKDLEKLNLVELLDLMADIHTPEAVSYWPQTTSWLVVAFVLLAIAVLISWRWLKLRNDNQYRRQALQVLDGIAAGSDDPAAQLTAVAGVVRRVALLSFPREQVASLCGDDWLRFLDATGNDLRFGEGPGRCLAVAPYARQSQPSDGELQAVFDLAAKWIGSHPRGGGGA